MGCSGRSKSSSLPRSSYPGSRLWHAVSRGKPLLHRPGRLGGRGSGRGLSVLGLLAIPMSFLAAILSVSLSSVHPSHSPSSPSISSNVLKPFSLKGAHLMWYTLLPGAPGREAVAHKALRAVASFGGCHCPDFLFLLAWEGGVGGVGVLGGTGAVCVWVGGWVKNTGL